MAELPFYVISNKCYIPVIFPKSCHTGITVLGDRIVYRA